MAPVEKPEVLEAESWPGVNSSRSTKRRSTRLRSSRKHADDESVQEERPLKMARTSGSGRSAIEVSLRKKLDRGL